jgi:TPP-dependent pyruvate/acetoin dehydrogenase alpha subunit
VLERIESEVRTEMEAGVQFAMNAAFPRAEEVTEDVFA